VIEPEPLDALIEGWRDDPPPSLRAEAGRDEFLLLSKTGKRKLPTPPQQNNHGNFIVSLGALCAWLAPKAEALGVDLFPGFAASDLSSTTRRAPFKASSLATWGWIDRAMSPKTATFRASRFAQP
jgi:flavin-dependent dehydrogenase